MVSDSHEFHRIPAVVWMLHPEEGDSWALHGEYDDLLWQALCTKLELQGTVATVMSELPQSWEPFPDIIVLSALNRTAPQAVNWLHRVREANFLGPIYVTGRAGFEFVNAFGRSFQCQYMPEDELPSVLGGTDGNSNWWATTTPDRGNRPKLQQGVLDIQATRGCDYACSFCSVELCRDGSRRRWFARPPADIAREIGRLCKTGTDRVQFIDDSFLGSPRESPTWVDELSRQLKRYAPDIRFSIYARLDATLIKCLPALRDSGLIQVHGGVECAHDKTLKRLRKGVSISTINRACVELFRLGIELVPSFIVFEQRSSAEEVSATLDWIQCGNWEAYFTSSRLLPYAGTKVLTEFTSRLGFKPKFMDAHANVAVDLPFDHPAVAEAWTAAKDFELYHRDKLDRLMRHRMRRDTDLQCRSRLEDPLIQELALLRSQQISIIRSILD